MIVTDGTRKYTFWINSNIGETIMEEYKKIVHLKEQS